MTPLLLGLIGLALAQPIPAALARARWTLRSPMAGIILWQSLALAAILAMSGAGLSTALWLVSGDHPADWRVALHAAVLGFGVLVWARFWWSAWYSWRDTLAGRERHRRLVDLLGEPHGLVPAVWILEAETPVAYCIPKLGDNRVVVSRGTIDALGASSLDAVLEHERAHVRARHDLVLEGFRFLHRAFPRVLRTDAPLRQSQVMVELLADDAARRRTGGTALAQAIVALAGSAAPAGALGAGSEAAVRLERIRRRDPWGDRLAAVACYAVSGVVLVAPTVLLAVPWMLHAWSELT